MKYSLTKALFATFLISSSLHAQDIDHLNNEVQQLEKQLAELKGEAPDIKNKLTDEEYQEKQKRIAKAIAEAKQKTALNRAKALASASPQYKRALEMQQRYATYTEGVLSGELRAFPKIVENWGYYQSQAKTLSTDYGNYKLAKTATEKAKLAAPLLNALQPLGRVLKNASHGKYERVTLTEAQFSEQENLMNAYNTATTADGDSGGKMVLTTPSEFYTLKELPIPIQFSAPEGTEIFLFSELGGRFENKLNYIKLVADEHGIASTSWSTPGDAVAECAIHFKSSAYNSRGMIIPIVKQLNLMPLEFISPLVDVATKKVQNELKAKVLSK